MTGHASAFLIALAFAAPAAANGLDFFKRPKSESQVKRLVETAKADPDEKKRHAAVVELREADPRIHTDVIPTLIATLQKDASAAVRKDAADTLASYKFVYPLAGLALEAASELDSAGEVRDAAKEALWEYHLAGYRSPRGANGIAGQTAEPPIARPLAVHRPKVTPVSASDFPVPQEMPVVKLPPVSPLPPPSPRSKVFDSPVLLRRPALDALAPLKAVLPRLRKEEPSEPLATAEPPLAAKPEVEAAPEPRSIAFPPHVVVPQPFTLPTLVEPPGELPPVMRPMLVPSESPVGPRVRPAR